MCRQPIKETEKMIRQVLSIAEEFENTDDPYMIS